MTPFLLQSTFLAAFVLSLALTPLFAALARRLRIVDRPSHRKTHKEPVSYLGGCAVLLSIVGAGFFGLVYHPGNAGAFTGRGFLKVFFILAPALGVGLVGLLDDVAQLRPRYKFMGQLVFSLAFACFGFRFEVFHLPGFPAVPLGLLSIPVTVFWILAIVNAFNMVDGIDGLAASVSAGSLTLLAIACALVGSGLELVMATAGLGAVLGFLPFNWKPAKVYLGDAGSGGLGMFLACSLVCLGQSYGQPLTDPGYVLGQPFLYQILITTLLVAYPALEITLSVARRLVHGRPISRADQGHIHHRLLKAGWQVTGVCLAALALNVLPGLAALTTLAKYHGWATWLLSICGVVVGLGLSTLGFLDFLKPKVVERLRPHYQIAHHFVSMQKIKLTLASTREDVLTLVNQVCNEMGVAGYRLIVRPDEKGKGGLDYTHEWDPTLKGGDPSWRGTVDQVRLPGGLAAAEWTFEPHGPQEELDMEYRVILSEFMREALATALRLGAHQDTVEYASVVAFPQRRVSGYALRLSKGQASNKRPRA